MHHDSVHAIDDRCILSPPRHRRQDAAAGLWIRAAQATPCTAWQTAPVKVERGAALVALLLSVLVLTACTAAPAADAPAERTAAATPTARPSDHAVDGLAATVVQYTRDRPARVVQVKVANTGAEDVAVTLIEPRLRGFDAAEPPPQTSDLWPGRRVDFPVALGPPSCDEQPGPSEVVVRGVAADGVAVDHRVPVTDEHGLIPRVHRLDCEVQRVEQAVEITLADTWRQVGEGADAVVRGRVTMALRPGGAPARVADLDGGILLRVSAGRPDDTGDPTYGVDAERPRTAWEVELVGARCDGHAIAESQRLMALTFWVSVDGAAPAPVRRTPDVDGYQTMVAALLERCEHQGREP